MLFKGLDDREFQSTLPVRGATENAPIGHGERPISIHAPRAGSDGAVGMTNDVLAEFQSTLPVRGATRHSQTANRRQGEFQSTLPVRGATQTVWRQERCLLDFNPRSPCGERLTQPTY